MNNKIVGYIYCAIIKFYPDYIKVGCTIDINSRMKQLSGQLIENFTCIFFIEVKYSQMFIIEKKIHNDIINANYERINNTEFFRCNPEQIKYIFDKYSNTQNDNYKNNIIMKYKEKKKNYICDICNFESNNKTNYENHLHTKTHINNITPENQFCCDSCLKIFKYKSGLYKHKNICNSRKK